MADFCDPENVTRNVSDRMAEFSELPKDVFPLVHPVGFLQRAVEGHPATDRTHENRFSIAPHIFFALLFSERLSERAAVISGGLVIRKASSSVRHRLRPTRITSIKDVLSNDKSVTYDQFVSVLISSKKLFS